MSMFSGLVRVMERAARKAGNRLRRDFGEVEHLQVSRKGPADFVSKADLRAERILYDELLHARPDWGFVFEEAGIIEGDADKPRWIVDRSMERPISCTASRISRSLSQLKNRSSTEAAGARLPLA